MDALKLPKEIAGGLFLMVGTGEVYDSHVVSASQFLAMWGELMFFGGLKEADPELLEDFSKAVCNLDEWCSDSNGLPTSFSWVAGEDASIEIHRITVGAGAALIAAERARQVAVEGWTAEHDNVLHAGGELAQAAASYLATVAEPDEWAKHHGKRPAPAHDWPWAMMWWKPSADPVRNLVKAGALIAAEIDRLKRAKAKAGKEGV